MSRGKAPVQLDANVSYEEKMPVKRRKKRSGLLITSSTGLLLTVMLLLYQPDSDGFIESPPPAEQAERDSIAALALVITSFSAIAIPKFSNVAESAGYTACRLNLRNIATALNLYLAENNGYPAGNGWKKLTTISDYVHTELVCPATEALYRYRIIGEMRTVKETTAGTRTTST